MCRDCEGAGGDDGDGSRPGYCGVPLALTAMMMMMVMMAMMTMIMIMMKVLLMMLTTMMIPDLDIEECPWH